MQLYGFLTSKKRKTAFDRFILNQNEVHDVIFLNYLF